MVPQRFRLHNIGSLLGTFGLSQLRADPNCILIQDPSQVWGVQDFLPRRNLLLATDTLATQNVAVVATAYKLYMQGTGSITLSGTATGTLNGTGANDRVSLSFTPTAGTLTLTVSGTVTFGMLCRADTIDQTYQKITDWTTEQYQWAAQKSVPWLRRNRFLNTATLSTQTVSSVTASPITVSFKGTGTITFSTAYSGSLVGTGANDRVSATFTPSAGNLVCTVSGTVTEAQCENASAATEYQLIGASWDATYTANAIAAGYPISLWQDAAGTSAVNGDNQAIGKMLNYKLNGLYDATQATAANQPKWRLDSNGKPYIERDLVNDALPVTFPNLGSNCVIYAAEGNVTLKDYGITLNGSFAPITPAADYGRIIMAAESKYDSKIIRYLDQNRGRAYSLGPELVTNGGFDSDTWWSKSTGVTISSGVCTFASVATGNGVGKSGLVTVGKTYAITYTISSVTAGGAYAWMGVVPWSAHTSAGTYTDIVTATNTAFYIFTLGTGSFVLDNLSVREVLL